MKTATRNELAASIAALEARLAMNSALTAACEAQRVADLVTRRIERSRAIRAWGGQ